MYECYASIHFPHPLGWKQGHQNSVVERASPLLPMISPGRWAHTNICGRASPWVLVGWSGRPPETPSASVDAVQNHSRWSDPCGSRKFERWPSRTSHDRYPSVYIDHVQTISTTAAITKVLY